MSDFENSSGNKNVRNEGTRAGRDHKKENFIPSDGM
jgi:hypothetical protein